ncbi:hypothetical protein [Sphingomonas sp. TZW2008]|nr:hypothetical protein [Sphingomonas sp. TZW2008]
MPRTIITQIQLTSEIFGRYGPYRTIEHPQIGTKPTRTSGEDADAQD